MCGRFSNYFADNTIIGAFDLDRVVQTAATSWNIAPTQPITVVLEQAHQLADLPSPAATSPKPDRAAWVARWGLVPSWAKDSKAAYRLINARSETVTEKPSFRAAARRRRALIPAAGYFEWQPNSAGTKTPFYLHPEPDGQVLALAGLYEWWQDPAKSKHQAEPLLSATIITRPATDQLGQIHDRMPLIVPPELFGDWLDPAPHTAGQVMAMMAAMPDPRLTPRQVSPAVGSVRNNHPGLLLPAT